MNARLSLIEAKLNLILHADKTWRKMLWAIIPTVSITMPWPQGNNSITAPTELWRPWLEEHVGRQGWSWDWRISQNCYDVEILFRRSKEKYITAFLLRWS